jgi:hypothetical protein
MPRTDGWVGSIFGSLPLRMSVTVRRRAQCQEFLDLRELVRLVGGELAAALRRRGRLVVDRTAHLRLVVGHVLPVLLGDLGELLGAPGDELALGDLLGLLGEGFLLLVLEQVLETHG